ncbi:MAG: Peptidoglycan synthase FtsI [Verrucomicrobiales bacterium]|nr:Peptidoglycan synthase FtsI [Verrucomicrobiales bacterium]
MLVFDQLKKNDPHLRVLTIGVLCGLGILLAGLWNVQVFSHGRYKENQMAQAYRTVRIPAIRGKIVDRNGTPLAENQPSYNLNIYLDELRDQFKTEWRKSDPKRSDPKQKLKRSEIASLEVASRCRVISNMVQHISDVVQYPIPFTEGQFLKHYTNSLALPMPVLLRLNPEQIARYEESAGNQLALDLEIQPARFYPNKGIGAHVLGFLLRDDSSAEDEESFFNFRMPDYRGRVGIEGAFDVELRGKAGIKSVLVNSLGYRQSENIWSPAEPGKNVILTIDLEVQKAAEIALRGAVVAEPPVCGSAVVMDPRNGDILAMVSVPGYDPNIFIPRISHEDYQPLTNKVLKPQFNRATQGNYAPGSIFKIVVGMAALEAGLDPNEKIYNQPNPRDPAHGHIMVGKHPVKDTAPPGEYNFKLAFMKSSNTYFITQGLRYGLDGVMKLGQRLHLGELTGLSTRQENSGTFLSYQAVRRAWSDGDTANVCIGQTPIEVNPLQIAVLISSIANGGKVLWPRLVDRVEPQEYMGEEMVTRFEAGKLRDNLGISQRTLDIVRDAMRADVEDEGGTGAATRIQGFRVCAKTGTAQIKNTRGQTTDHTTWYASYGPYEDPRYVVIVMIEGGSSGGGTCGPVARKIYETLIKRETQRGPKGSVLAKKD